MAPDMKSVLITGCSDGGIGSALALSFHARNFHVFATARTLSKMSQLSCLEHTTLLTLDVTSPSSIASAVSAVETITGGSLDYLVNNSGVSYVMPILDTNIVEAKAMFDVNFWGSIAVTQAFAPMILKVKGCIVNTCSISGILVVPWMGAYGASKSALIEASETLRLEMAPFGVRVVTIITGAVESMIMNKGNGPGFKLPEGSRYRSVERRIGEMARGEDGSKKDRMKVKDYAEKVVGDVLGGATGKIWRGGLATTVKYASSYAPASIIEGPTCKNAGVDILERAIRDGSA